MNVSTIYQQLEKQKETIVKEKWNTHYFWGMIDAVNESLKIIRSYCNEPLPFTICAWCFPSKNKVSFFIHGDLVQSNESKNNIKISHGICGRHYSKMLGLKKENPILEGKLVQTITRPGLDLENN